MKNKFKLSPADYKHIKTVAMNLPQFQRVKDGKPMTRIVTKNQTSEYVPDGAMGKIKNSFQRVEEPIMVNHELNLIEVFKKDGMSGVETYCAHFVNLYKQEKAEQLKETEVQP
jgi:hypothetical protein